jgi:iron complex outermembrane recepter protein
MEFFINGDVNYQSSKFTQVHNLAETGDSTVVGLRTGIETDRFSLTVFGRNLTDEDSVVAVTRWLQPPYSNQSAFFAQGLGTRNINCSTPTVGAACAVPTNVDTGQPRAFFGTLRKGRTFGVEGRVKF